MKKLTLMMIAAALAGVLAACANTVTADRPVPHYAYKQYPPLMLNVGAIEVVDYTPSMRAPNVEHLMPQPLPAAVSDWANTRFKPIGTAGTLVITVRDASMIGRDLNRSNGLRGVFTVEQAERYDASVQVDFAIRDAADGSTGNGTVKVGRGSTISEEASLQDRDRTWTKIAEDMMVDLDAATLTMMQNRMPALMTK